MYATKSRRVSPRPAFGKSYNENPLTKEIGDFPRTHAKRITRAKKEPRAHAKTAPTGLAGAAKELEGGSACAGRGEAKRSFALRKRGIEGSSWRIDRGVSIDLVSYFGLARKVS